MIFPMMPVINCRASDELLAQGGEDVLQRGERSSTSFIRRTVRAQVEQFNRAHIGTGAPRI